MELDELKNGEEVKLLSPPTFPRSGVVKSLKSVLAGAELDIGEASVV